jgi:glycosyltransferase involved in cell wall biosynthesis
VRELAPALLQPTSNYVNAQVALAVGERFDLPVVYEVRGFLEETWLSRMGAGAETADRYLATRAVETAAMRRAAAIVTLSETMRTDILARGGVEADKVVVIPNGVDVDRFQPGPRDDALASRLGIELDETVIGYISSFVSYEGIGTLIEAVARLRALHRRVRLLLVGDGEDRPALEAIAARTGLKTDGTVIFTGRVPHHEIERYYRTIDIFVVPRTSDRVSQLVTPLKPYEAMAMARPVVVSAVAALLEIVSDGETGRTFRPDDPDDLARVIGELLDDPAQRARLGHAARAWVAANRTWTHNGERYLTLYRALGIA